MREYIIMGCGALKRQMNAGLNLELQESGDPRLDAIFKELEEPLSLLLACRKQLKRALKGFQKEVGVYKQLKNPTFFDFLMAMLFCLSASGEGELEAVELTFGREAPFISVNEDLLYVEHRGIMPAWKTLIALAVSLPDILEPLRRQIQTAIRQTESSLQPGNPVESDPTTVGESQASPLAVKTISENLNKLALAPGVLDEVLTQAMEITATVAKLPSILSEANPAIKAVGQQAYIDLRLDPRDIVAKYWPSSKPLLR